MLEAPFTLVLAGPSFSGKSTWIKKLIDHAHFRIFPAPTKIIYVIHEKSTVPVFEKDVQIVHGLDNFRPVNNSLCIIDDLYAQAMKDERVLHMFTRGSHHENYSLILSQQNLFANSEGKYATTISRNAKYIVVFRSIRNLLPVKTLCSQVFPQKWKTALEAFDAATENPFSYLIFDFGARTHPHLRLYSNVFFEDGHFVKVYRVE